MQENRKNNELLEAATACLSEAEQRMMGLIPDPAPEAALRARLARTLAEDSIATSQELEPQRRSQDRKDLYPWQGKESDAEIMFAFERLADAQDLYDFVLETQLVVPGEVKLKVHESGAHAQYSVHFAANVLVQKPDVIQAAMIAYQDQLGEGCEAAWDALVEDVDAVLAERSERGSAEPMTTGRGVDFNPYHDKYGEFSSREGMSDGGSWSDGKKVRLKATKRGAKLHFAGTKRPCGREARARGQNMRCWDGQPGPGVELARMVKAKKKSGPRAMPNYRGKQEGLDRAGRAALQECWARYGIPLAFVGDGMVEASGATATVLGCGVRRTGTRITMGQMLAAADRAADLPATVAEASAAGTRATRQIVAYLTKHGKMSGRDIVDALGVEEWDVLDAEEAGAIERAKPTPGGTGPWYQVSRGK